MVTVAGVGVGVGVGVGASLAKHFPQVQTERGLAEDKIKRDVPRAEKEETATPRGRSHIAEVRLVRPALRAPRPAAAAMARTNDFIVVFNIITLILGLIVL